MSKTKYKYPPLDTMPAELWAAHYASFIGTGRYEELVKKYPEWFPDVLDWRRKLALVPQEVHDAYHEELSANFSKFFHAGPHPGKGIMWYLNNPEKYQERLEWEKTNPWPSTKEVWNKYYAEYDLER